jgi:hypothetical protein
MRAAISPKVRTSVTARPPTVEVICRTACLPSASSWGFDLEPPRARAIALSDRSAATIVKDRAAAIGLSPETFAGHSLRAGYVTSAVEANAPLMKIVEQTLPVDRVRVYSRRVDLFRDHSGAAFL